MRDLSPLVIFGIGRNLDTSVLVTLVGSILGSSALAVVLPSYLPMVARGEDVRSRLHRFAGLVVLLGIALVLFRRPILAGLGLRSEQSLAYILAIGSGVLLGISSCLIVCLHARRTNLFALAVPAAAGPCVLVALLVYPSPVTYALGLLVGSVVDLAFLSILASRKHAEPASPRARGATESSVPGKVRFLYLSQVVALITVYLERAMASRFGNGAIGAMTTGNRLAYGVVAIVAGSLAPSLMRHSAQSRLATFHRLGIVLTRLALATVSLLGVALLLIAWHPHTSPLAVALVVYLLSLPTLTALRAAQAVLQGSALLRYDFAVVGVGALATLALARLALEYSSVALLMCATPLAACAGSLVAGRRLRTGIGVGAPLGA